MKRSLSRRRWNWLIIFTLALVGAASSFYVLLGSGEGGGYESLVQLAVAVPEQPGANATLTVYLFGRELYTRSAPNVASFQRDDIFWLWVLPTILILGGAVAGGLLGCVIDWWLLRRSRFELRNGIVPG